VEGSDALLVARLAAGDDHALVEVYDGLAGAVFRVALRVTGEASAAQDVVQDVFVQLWAHPERYDPAVAPLRTFLMVLARSRALDQVRSDVRRAARQQRLHQLTRSPRNLRRVRRWLLPKRPGSCRTPCGSCPPISAV